MIRHVVLVTVEFVAELQGRLHCRLSNGESTAWKTRARKTSVEAGAEWGAESGGEQWGQLDTTTPLPASVPRRSEP